MSEKVEMTIQWGGYYTSPPGDGGQYRVIRLLDFNRDAYHACFYEERFATPPTLDELKDLRPAIMHAPIDARALVKSPHILLGAAPLTREDLEGYRTYLEQNDFPANELEGFIDRVVAFSHEPPLPLEFALVDDELVISEANAEHTPRTAASKQDWPSGPNGRHA